MYNKYININVVQTSASARRHGDKMLPTKTGEENIKVRLKTSESPAPEESFPTRLD